MKIRVLPDHVVNMISAGEVVERPASVVKELLENSLDAGARSIRVELERGGRKSITVRDDGCGMSRHDLLLSVQRHATSKLASVEDLDSVSTLGFRGEALPSIAAVTHMTIVTSDGESGWKLVIDGGVIRDVEPAPRTRGTTITASGIFYNTPARRKFLRSEATELGWVERFLTGCAIARCDASFVLVHNGRELFTLPPGQTPEERIRSRYGLPAGTRAVSLNGGRGDVKVRLVFVPDQRWSSRRHQYVLVNGRLVYSKVIQEPLDAVLSGPAGFPLCVCRVDLPAHQVDVNAHPAKREVRFGNPREVEGAVSDTLADAAAGRADSMTVHGAFRPFHYVKPLAVSETPALFRAAMELQAGREEVGAGAAEGGREAVSIVQIGDAWLVSATDEGMVIVDQHAAHERILFEDVLRSSGNTGGQQRLLIPETVKLDPETLEMLLLYEAVIREAGFDFEADGDTLVLQAVPAGVRHGIDAIREVLSTLETGSDIDMPHHERVAAATACAGSIKFGDRLTVEEARSLLDRLFTTSDPFHCPHGRPTLIEIPFAELEHRFGR